MQPRAVRMAPTLKNGHAEHIHTHCDCEYAVRFDDESGVRGYDPDAYYRRYRAAEGDTWQEKLNSMRREQYAANPDKYRAQQRMRNARVEKAQTINET